MNIIKNGIYALPLDQSTQENLKEELRRAFHIVLINNKETIKRLEDIKKVAGWYKEAKEKGQDGILLKIINEIIREFFIQNIEQYFINSLIENINVEVQKNTDEIKIDVSVNFKPIKPSIEFVKVFDGKEISPTLRFVFKIDIAGAFNGLIISSSGNKKKINMDKFSFILTISVVEVSTHKLLNPIVLYCNEHFKIENLHFYI